MSVLLATTEPSPSPSPEPSPEPPPPAGCDELQALYARQDGATGCELHAVVLPPDVWMPVGLVAVSIALACLAALVIGMLRG